MAYSKSRKGRLIAAVLAVVLVLVTAFVIILIERQRQILPFYLFRVENTNSQIS